MRRFRVKRPSPSMVVSLVALVLAMGGTGYAAVSIPKNSVGTKQLKNKAVTSQKLKGNAVNGSKIANGSITGPKVVTDSLTGNQINETTLGKVPSAGTADAAAIARVKTNTAAGTAAAGGGIGTATATCDQGLVVLGGGVQVADPSNEFVIDDFPSGTGAFTARVLNGAGSALGFTVYAICAPAAATG